MIKSSNDKMIKKLYNTCRTSLEFPECTDSHVHFLEIIQFP